MAGACRRETTSLCTSWCVPDESDDKRQSGRQCDRATKDDEAHLGVDDETDKDGDVVRREPGEADSTPE